MAEVIVSTLVLSFITLGVFMFTRDIGLISFVNTAKMNINADFRDLTNELMDNGRDATLGFVYESFYDEDLRTPPTGKTGASYRLRDDESGDFLLLVFYGQDTTPADTVAPPIERIVGYYRAVDTDEELGPVRRFDITYDPPMEGSASDPLEVEELIPDISDSEDHDTVVELARGLADQRLFFNYRNRSILVNGQIYHGNDAKRVTDTYNFTITPRGPTGNEQFR